MPRIRKKTSKRVSINKREKVKKQVKETKRKKSKQAKKSPQWKSKHAKDPGIPNSFPYKDQILAEVAEERRLAAEEKQKRKDEKRAAKTQAAEDVEDEDEVVFDGVRAIAAPRAVGGNHDEDDAMDAEVDEEEEVPVLINPDLPNLKVVLDAADVVIEVLDARDPLSSRSAHLEEVAKELGKRVLLVLNKIDTCPKEAVEAWAATLRQEHPTVLFRSSSVCLPVSAADTWSKGKGKERERADDAWGLDTLTPLLQQWATEKPGDEPLTLAVVGVTNVGKTSFVNSVLRKAALQTYTLASSTNDFSPTTTTHPQEVTIDLDGGKSLRVIDTPGLLWHHAEDLSDEDMARIRARDILLRNRGHVERLKDPSAVMSELVSRSSREDLMLMYNLPIFMDGDATAFLSTFARANGFMKKNGSPDLTGAGRTVLRDWSSGKFARYTTPSNPSSAPGTSDKSLSDFYAKDGAILSKLSTRKELRKTGGLVKLRTGDIDARKIMLDAGYFVSASDDGVEADEEDGGALDDMDEVDLDEEESEGGDDDEDEDEGGEEDEEEDEDEDEEEVDELESPPPRGKRKRALAKAPARPAKRVAFAPEPKGTKQARSAAGAKGAAASKVNAKADKRAPKAAKKPVKAAAKAAPKAAVPPKKVANAASSKKGAASAAKDGEVAYDFKQFF